MRHYFFLITLTLASAVHAQNFVGPASPLTRQLLPHPYVFAGPEGMGGGYAPFAVIAGAGIAIESQHFILDANAWYDNGHKTNDNDQPNPKGHDRGLVGSAYFRLSSGWAFGGGYRWSQLSTTNYTKGGSRPTFGGSRDFFVEGCRAEDCRGTFTMRIGVDYVLPGTDHQNASQGPLISFYTPSPSLKRHLFFREKLGIYRFHDTVTDPTNAILTREQTSHHSFDSFLELTLMYRF